MKIGIFSPYLDSLGGGERYMLTIAEHLSQKHSVDIFWNDEKIRKKAFQRLAIDLKRVNFIDDIFYSPKNLFKKLVLSCQYDLIFFLSDGSVPTTLAKKNILHFQRPFSQVKGQSWLNKLKLMRFQAVICNSGFTKRFIDREYGVRSQIIYPPVEVGEFQAVDKKNMILSVGRFSKEPIHNKKQIEMIGFFKKLVTKLPNWQLVLIGGLLEQDRDYFKKVKEISQGLPVEVLANISFKKLKEYYGKAKIYWHAAGFGKDKKENPAAMEHFGISTVEAMASGCVTIVFNGGGLREIIEGEKDGFLWKTREELIAYTLKIVNNETLREKIAKEAIKKSKLFSKEKFCQRIDQLITSII